jgi:Uma2 family endonuclease
MTRPMTVDDFLQIPDRSPHLELIYGFLRPGQPLSPRYAPLIERVRAPLADHLTTHRRGEVLVAPLDVVVHPEDDIVLHPPLVVVLDESRSLIRSPTCVWGAPDIVLEVLTPATARRIRCSKLRWYRLSGVKECWMLDTRHKRVEVLDFRAGNTLPHIFSGRRSLRSQVLTTFCLEVGRLFR